MCYGLAAYHCLRSGPIQQHKTKGINFLKNDAGKEIDIALGRRKQNLLQSFPKRRNLINKVRIIIRTEENRKEEERKNAQRRITELYMHRR